METLFSPEVNEKIERGIFELFNEEVEYHGEFYRKVKENSELHYNILGLPEIYKDKTFSNYKKTDENRWVIQLLKEPSEKIGILIHGNTGTGKTHISVAKAKTLGKKKIYTYYIESDKWAVDYYAPPIVRFVNMDELLNVISDSGILRKPKMDIIAETVANDLLIIDDVDFEKMNPTKIEWTYLLINKLIEENRKFIITTNNSLMQIKSKDSRISSRLSGSCDIYEFIWGDFRSAPSK